MHPDRRPLQLLVLLAACVAGNCALAAGPKPCAALRAEIAAKIDARGVANYALEIVAPDAIGERKVVGSCEGGSKRIVYLRLPAKDAAEAPAVASRGG